MRPAATLQALEVARDGSRRSLADFSARIEPGALVLARGGEREGLTLIKTLCRTLEPDRGRLVLLAGAETLDLTHAGARAVAWARKRWLGVFDGQLRALPNRTALRVVAGRDGGGERDREVLGDLGMSAATEPVGLLEERERTIVALAAALVRPAPVLLLHRPLAGLEPAPRERVLALVDRAREAGSAVLATVSAAESVTADADVSLGGRR